LARLMSPATTTPPPPPADTIPPSVPTNLVVTSTTDKSATLSWTASSDNVGITGYDVYQGTALVQANVTSTTVTINALTCATNYSFSVRAKDAAGNVSAFSNTASATTKPCTVVGNTIIYDDAIGADWSDVSTATSRNFSATNIVKVGTRSIRVDYTGTTTLAFQKGSAITTSATTQLRFWTYNASKNGIRIYTESGTGVKSADVYSKTASNKWVEVVVNLSQLGNPATIRKVVIGHNSNKSGTMYFDQIELTNTAATATPTLARTSESSLSEVAAAADWKVYPNPATHYLTIELRAAAASRQVLTIHDKAGRVVYRQQVYLSAGINQWQQTLPKLTPGVYTLSINDGQAVRKQTIMIQ